MQVADNLVQYRLFCVDQLISFTIEKCANKKASHFCKAFRWWEILDSSAAADSALPFEKRDALNQLN